jgi:hypothetical protein
MNPQTNDPIGKKLYTHITRAITVFSERLPPHIFHRPGLSTKNTIAVRSHNIFINNKQQRRHSGF